MQGWTVAEARAQPLEDLYLLGAFSWLEADHFRERHPSSGASSPRGPGGGSGSPPKQRTVEFQLKG